MKISVATIVEKVVCNSSGPDTPSGAKVTKSGQTVRKSLQYRDLFVSHFSAAFSLKQKEKGASGP